ARPTRPSTRCARPCWTSRATTRRSPCRASRTSCASATPTGPRRTSATPASCSSSRRPRPRASSRWNGTTKKATTSCTFPTEPVALEVREARTPEEVAAAGRVTVAANAEFAPSDPGNAFVPTWNRYLASMADAAGRAADVGVVLVAVEDGRVVGTATLYLDDGSEQGRPAVAVCLFLVSW